LKIHANQLSRQLKGNTLPLYWVSGDETLLVQEATDHIRQYLAQHDYSEREVWHVDASMDWQALLLSANSLSLFSSRKRLELRFTNSKPGDKALKALAEYAQSPNPDCVMLASGPKLDTAASRSKAFKQLEAASLLVQIWPIESHKLPDWIAAQLQQGGCRATREALLLLSERVEGNLLAARQEIDKLLLSTTAGDLIEADTVARSVADSARYSVFDLSEPLLLGQSKSVLRMINGLREEGVDASALLWALSRDLRRLMHLRQTVDRGQRIDSAMEKQGIWKKQQRSFTIAVKRLPLPTLECALDTARMADLGIKGLAPVDPWNEIRSLAMTICGHSLFTHDDAHPPTNPDSAPSKPTPGAGYETIT
jgi:DNA polymerase-3 subunit delta